MLVFVLCLSSGHCTHLLTHTCTHTYIHAHAHIHTHHRTHTCMHTCTHTHTHTHTHTQTYMHTHTHTHTHMTVLLEWLASYLKQNYCRYLYYSYAKYSLIQFNVSHVCHQLQFTYSGNKVFIISKLHDLEKDLWPAG